MGSALKNKGVQQMIDSVVHYLPNPSEVKNFANLCDSEENFEKIFMCPDRISDPKLLKPFIGLAFKLEAGRTFFRIYQGRLSKGDTIYATRDGRKVKISKLVRMHANNMMEIDVAYAGDICAVLGLECASGETFCSDPSMNVHCESMFIPDPVISMSIKPTSKVISDTFLSALKRFSNEDPTFHMEYRKDHRETIISGMGELHLEIYAQRMKNEFDCPVELGQPAVSYKETLKTPYRFNFRHKKQTGGHGQFGEIEGVINPQPPERNTIVEFTDNSVGEGVPKKFMSSLRKGLEAITKEGPLIKAPVTGIEVILQDGKTHIVDTTDIAMIATMMNMMREAYERANWMLLEPVVKVECVVPMEFESQVVKTLIERKGIVTATATGAEYSTLECEAPLREMFGYSTILRTQTQGKGEFTMEFKRYTPVEPYIQDEVIYDWKVANGIINPEKEKKKQRR
uniref:Uncharacterized protein n=1 Tax=Meloidogyne enterolobii TaxID=390850 RepID=A0A6V7VM45_MELEN|nr:unnamed protein product [Meloidogyne enterolobii]